jgi:hypothetical protein
LKLRKTYKKWASALLLLLYLFVVTPTNYWHKHSSFKKQTTKEASCQKSAASDEADCKVCTHHYATSINNANFCQLNPTYWQIVYSHFNKYTLIEEPILSSFNKGPPKG